MARKNKKTNAVAVTPDLKNEIATIEKDFTKMLYGTVLPNSDSTLKSRAGSKGLDLYDDIERDCHAGSVLDKRKNAVIARAWDIRPASDSAEDKAVADFIKKTFLNMPFDQLCKDLLGATLKGYAVVEILWTVNDDNEIVPGKCIARNQRRFVFGKDRELRMLTRSAMTDGELMPDRKFIVHTYGGLEGSPYGLGLGNKLFWPVFFKRQDIAFWLVFAEKFGSPTAIGKYPRGSLKSEQDKLLDSIGRIAQDTGIIIPDGMVVELLEASRSSASDFYERLARYMDEQISEAVLGETLTTNMQGGGSFAAAKTHNGVRLEVAQGDSDLLTPTLTNTLIQWLVDFNFPGAKAPTLWRDFTDPEDLNARADRDKKLDEMGFGMTDEYVLDTYGDGFVRKQTALPDPFKNATASSGPAFADPSGKISAQRQRNETDQQTLANASDALAGQWRDFVEPMLKQVQTLLDETGDLQLARDRLGELLQQEPNKKMVTALQQSAFSAQMLGRMPR